MPASLPPVPYRKRRPKLKPRPFTPPTPAALVLLSAAFNAAGSSSSLTLTFDRNMNLDAFDPATVAVDDTASGHAYAALSAYSVEGAQVDIRMNVSGTSGGSGTTLTVTAGSGIVGEDAGVEWDGASALGLPYP